MKKVFLAALLSLSLSGVTAQEQRIVSQFFMNPYVYNPAYAGVEGHSAVYVMYRSQWVGLEGAPTFSHVNFHTPLKKGLALGILGYNDQESILTTSGLKGTLSYLAAFDKKHYIRFGMSLGLGTSRLDINQIDNPFDPAFANLVESSNFAIVDFGATYHSGHFNFGFAIPNLISRDVLSEDGISKVTISPTENVLFKVNYRGHISDDYAIEPHIIYRFSTVNASQYEIATIVHVKHLIWLGGSFRQDAGMTGLLGFKVKEKIGIGYAYELGNSDISSFTGATHELHIGYHLGTRKEHAEHVSSFIKSHRKSVEERAAEAERRRQERLLALQKASEVRARAEAQRNEGNETPTETASSDESWESGDTGEDLTRDNNGIRERGVRLERTNAQGEKEVVVSWVPEDDGSSDETWEMTDRDPLERTNPDGTKEVGVQWEVTNEQGVKSIVIKWSPVEGNISSNNEFNNNVDSGVTSTGQTNQVTNEELGNSNASIRVKRGTHILELPHGNHVIAGAFSEFQHAEDFSDDLFNQGFHDVIVGYVTQRGYYYTVVFRSDDIKKAEAQKNRLKRRAGFEKVWVLTVE